MSKWMREVKAAEHLGVTPMTMKRLRVAGDGPKHGKVGRFWVYKVEDLDEWAREQGQKMAGGEPC
jgi:hypothetical protein